MRRALQAGGTPLPEITAHPFAKRPVLLIASVVAIAHLAASFDRGYWFDEVSMLAIGRYHLDWGAADQPPVTPLLAALMDAIAPGSIPALRLPAVLSTAAAVVVAALIAREMGGDRRAQSVTAGAQATGLWTTVAGHWLTPYTLEPLQWLVLLWLLVRWLRLRDDRLLLVLGAVAGIAAETKFQSMLLCAALLLSCLAVGPRTLLGRPRLWAGAGIGALIALPTLLWQAFHGWPQLRMGPVVASEARALYGDRPQIALALLFLAGVAGTALALYGLGRLLLTRELRAYRFLAVTFLALYVVFVATAGRPYYLAGLYGLLTSAGALGMQRRRETTGARRRWLVWPAFALSAAAAGGMLAVASAATHQSDALGRHIAQRAAATYHALPPPEKHRTALLGRSYIIAAYLDGYSPTYDLPAAHSTNRSYGYFPPPPEEHDRVLYVGPNADELRPHFTTIREITGGGSRAKQATTWLCTGKREPWASLWPRLRHLDVS